MFILGIDTATRVAGAAVIGEGRLISERFIHNLKTHSQNIIPMIKQVVDDADITPADLAGIAVTAGPGSFTGLRIGMSVAKTMSLTLNIPVISVSTLKALAWNILGTKGLICPILDARKNEVYTSIYKSGDGGLVELIDPAALSIEKLMEEIAGTEGEVTFLGDAVPVYGEIVKEKLGPRARFASMINSFPRASAAAEIGLPLLKHADPAESIFLQPVYLRKSEAEVTWEQKHCGI